MATFVKTRTLVNPGRKRRKLSPKQIAIFGTKRQKAALKATRHRKHSKVANPRRRRRVAAVVNRKRRRHNPSKIITLSLPKFLSNPRRRRRTKRSVSNMARRRRRTLNPRRRISRRRRSLAVAPVRRRRRRLLANPRRRRYSRRRNPSVKVVYRRRTHRRHRRNAGRRSGSGALTGRIGSIAGLLGGAAVTGFVSNMLPASLTSGFIGYITTGVVALTQGKVIGGVLRNRSLGNSMVTGGLVYLGIKVIGDMFPSIGAYLPFSLRGMGLIAPSSFFVPQVNQAGSMGQFIRPSGVPGMVAVSAGMRGINTPYPYAHNTRRTGRVS